jgi:phage-related protein
MSTTMVQLGADLASFNNTSPEDALDALRSGLSGETEPLKRFGVNLNEAILKQEALRQGIYDGVGVLTPAQKAQAAYGVIMTQTAKAQGDFARTSDGAANKQKIVAAQWDDITTKIGTLFLPVVDRALTAVSNLLTLFDSGGMAAFVPPETQAQIATLKDALTEMSTTVMPTIREWYDTFIKPTMDKIKDAFAPLADEVIPTVTAIVDFISDNWPAIQQAIEPVMTAISNTVSGVMLVIAGVVRTVMALIRGDWDTAGKAIKTVWDGIVRILKGSTIGILITKAFEAIKKIPSWFAEMKSGITSKIDETISFVRSIPGRITAAIGNLATILYSAGQDTARGLWEGLQSMASWLTDKVWAWVKSVLPDAVEVALGISSPSKVFRDIGKQIPRGLALGIGDTSTDVEDAALALSDITGAPFGADWSASAPASGGMVFNFTNTSRADIPYIEEAVRRVLRGEVRSSMILGGAV